MGREPHIIWVVLDATRPDHLSCYGYRKPTAPNLERFCEEAIRFERARSASPWTLPSFASLLTGRYPSEHECDRPNPFFDCEHVSIAEILQERGYSTFFLSNNSWVSDRTYFDRGFDTFWKVWQRFQDRHDVASERAVGRFTEGKSHARALLGGLLKGNVAKNLVNSLFSRFVYRSRDDGAARQLQLCREYLDRMRSDTRPRFWMVHFLEPHLPFKTVEPFTSRFLPHGAGIEEAQRVNQNPWAYVCGQEQMSDRDFEILGGLYDAELAYTDDCAGSFFRMLRGAEVWDSAMVIVTADHGEHLGEHGFMDHQYSVYEPLLRVPLLVKLPGGERAGETIAEPVSSLDHFPSILELLGIDSTEVADPTPGKSYLGTLESERPTFAEYIHPQPSTDILRQYFPDCDPSRLDRWLRTVLQDDLKLILDSRGEMELYDVDADPDESVNLAPDRPEETTRLRAALDASPSTSKRYTAS